MSERGDATTDTTTNEATEATVAYTPVPEDEARVDPAMVGCHWLAPMVMQINDALRAENARGEGTLLEDVERLLEERRVLRWRIAEVQRLMDDGYDNGDRRVVSVSRRVMHFILTGRLDDVGR